jgi:hypothetical protein
VDGGDMVGLHEVHSVAVLEGGVQEVVVVGAPQRAFVVPCAVVGDILLWVRD